MAITVGSLLALFILVISAVVGILTPERLTPLVEKYASDYVDGKVEVSRVELTFWSTFPRLRVDVDSLTVTSGVVTSLPDSVKSKLPDDAGRLLSVAHFDGDIHLLRLLAGEIEVYNVNIVKPAATVVQVTPDVASYDIFPTSAEVDTTASGPLPDISIGSFVITGDAPLRYVSLPDSLDVAVTLSSSSLVNKETHAYDLQLKALTDARVSTIDLRGLRLGLGGRVIFDLSNPSRIEAAGLEFGLNELIVKLSVLVETEPQVLVKSFSLEVPRVKVTDLLAMVPPMMKEGIPSFETDATVVADLRLTSPFAVGGPDSVPSFDCNLIVDAGMFKLQQMDLHKLSLDLQANVDGHDLDRSVMTVRKMEVLGRAMGFKVDGTVHNPVSDPLAKVNFEGSLDFSRLPSVLLSRLPMTLKGVFEADASFKGRLSYLDRDNFHRVTATGRAALNGFEMKMRDGSLEAFMRHAKLNLGTSNSFVKDNHRIDSMLTVSLKADTLSLLTPDMKLGLSDMSAGIGMMNRASSFDTTMINPVGATFHIGRLNMISDSDTMKLTLRDVNARASLTRYQGGARSPLLSLNINAGRIRWADRFNRASLKDGDISLKLHPSGFKMPAISAEKRDSLRAVFAARRDSLEHVDSLDRREMIDMQVDRSMKKMLVRWKASGSMKAARARLMTPFYPVRCRLDNLHVDFTTDSVAITDTRLTVGKSNFTVNGSISNITRTLLSGRAPIKVDFRLESTNVDVNELATAAFAGSAFAEKLAAGEAVAVLQSEDDDAVEASIAGETTEIAALLVPSNVDADIAVKADRVTYSNIGFSDMAGVVRVHDGALNLDGLTARSDVGRLTLTALYSAPTRRDLNFAFGMNLNDFKIENFMELMPAVDSIMPLLRDIKGTINADIAATTTLDPQMNINLPTLSAVLKLSGDSLVLLDAETFRTIGKWLMFKNKQHNMVDHMSVRLTVKDSRLQLFPFMFDIDRYRLGVMGSNDLAMNYKYHVSVLKSPIPFKFGINISGNPDKMKIRLGGAKFKENMAGESVALTDTTRINLLKSIRSAFRRGVKGGKVAPLQFATPPDVSSDERGDTISHADSLLFIERGLIAAPPAPVPAPATKGGKKGKK